MALIRVLLVDDHEIVRLGLMTLINDQIDLQVVGEVGTAAEAILAVETLKPDVTLMDVRLPGESGIEATREIIKRNPTAKIVILTSYADDEQVMKAIQAGAVGYVLKQVGNQELLRAVRVAAAGEALLDPSTTAKLLSRVRESGRKAEEEAFRGLSERELEVIAEIARGKTNSQIGTKLNLSDKTVRNYVSIILEKLHLSNRTELATYAVERHIFDRFK